MVYGHMVYWFMAQDRVSKAEMMVAGAKKATTGKHPFACSR